MMKKLLCAIFVVAVMLSMMLLSSCNNEPTDRITDVITDQRTTVTTVRVTISNNGDLEYSPRY